MSGLALTRHEDEVARILSFLVEAKAHVSS